MIFPTMSTEIELKYFVSPKVGGSTIDSEITALLEQHKLSFQYQGKQLTNCYFDTLELNLRKADMGLRIRTSDSYREQTIKTAGQVIGGLHKRPEYNVEIVDNFPELALFPDEIWPSLEERNQWQENLKVLFTTDFYRHQWLVDWQGSKLELAYDSGSIVSGESSDAISEIEIELVSGNQSAIFNFAKILFSTFAVRPGTDSKAARGYRLFHGTKPEVNLEYFPLISTQSEMSLHQAFHSGLSYGLKHLQELVGAFFAKPKLSGVGHIYQSLILLRHGYWIFNESLTEQDIELRKELTHFITMLAWVNNAQNIQQLTTKKGIYRNKVEYSEQLVEQLKIERRRFPSLDQASELLQTERFNLLQLSLLEKLLNFDEQEDQSSSLVPYAIKALDKSLEQLDELLPTDDQLPSEQYLEVKKYLNYSLLTGSWLANLYDQEMRQEYRAPWLDLMSGIRELETLWILRQQLLALNEQPPKLLSWLDSKIDHLLMALDGSRNIALTIEPYWKVQ